MEKSYKESIDMWGLDADAGHVLHRVGSKDLTEIRHVTVRAADVDRWEELTVAEWEERRAKAERAGRYASMLAAAIHERYSVDDEIALAANINAPALAADGEKAASVAEEWQQYQAYRAECKERVRRELEMEN